MARHARRPAPIRRGAHEDLPDRLLLLMICPTRPTLEDVPLADLSLYAAARVGFSSLTGTAGRSSVRPCRRISAQSASVGVAIVPNT